MNTFFHGSKYPTLSFKYKDNNFGKQLFGYGFYVTPNRENAVDYYSLDGNTDGYLYTIKTHNLNIVDWHKPVDKKIITQIKKIPNIFNLFYFKLDFNDLNFDDYQYDTALFNFEWDYLDTPLPTWAVKENGKKGWFLEIYQEPNFRKIYYGLTKKQIINLIKNSGALGLKKSLSINDPHINVAITKDNLFDSFENLYWYITLKFKSTKKTSKFFANLNIDAIYSDYYHEENLNIINIDKILSFKKEFISFKDNYNGTSL